MIKIAEILGQTIQVSYMTVGILIIGLILNQAMNTRRNSKNHKNLRSILTVVLLLVALAAHGMDTLGMVALGVSLVTILVSRTRKNGKSVKATRTWLALGLTVIALI